MKPKYKILYDVICNFCLQRGFYCVLRNPHKIVYEIGEAPLLHIILYDRFGNTYHTVIYVYSRGQYFGYSNILTEYIKRHMPDARNLNI